MIAAAATGVLAEGAGAESWQVHIDAPSTAQTLGVSVEALITVEDEQGRPLEGVRIGLEIAGPNAGARVHVGSGWSNVTGSGGQINLWYRGWQVGTDTLTAYADMDGDGVRGDDEPYATTAVDWDVLEVGGWRHGGQDRFETASGISGIFWAGEPGAVVLARSDDFADALAGTPLAVALDGPILLTPPTFLHERTAEELHRLLPPGGHVYLLGGPAAISLAVEETIRELEYTPQRIAGEDRIETALEIARVLGDPSTLLLATGYDFPDALTAGAAAATAGGAVILTTPNQPHPSVDAYLAARHGASLFAIGGPAARAYPAATAVLGGTREETAVAVAERFFDRPGHVGVVRRDDFADALAGGAHVGKRKGPPLLTDTHMLSPVTASYLCANTVAIHTGVVYGGPAAIADATLDAVDSRIRQTSC